MTHFAFLCIIEYLALTWQHITHGKFLQAAESSTLIFLTLLIRSVGCFLPIGSPSHPLSLGQTSNPLPHRSWFIPTKWSGSTLPIWRHRISTAAVASITKRGTLRYLWLGLKRSVAKSNFLSHFRITVKYASATVYTCRADTRWPTGDVTLLTILLVFRASSTLPLCMTYWLLTPWWGGGAFVFEDLCIWIEMKLPFSPSRLLSYLILSCTSTNTPRSQGSPQDRAVKLSWCGIIVSFFSKTRTMQSILKFQEQYWLDSIKLCTVCIISYGMLYHMYTTHKTLLKTQMRDNETVLG